MTTEDWESRKKRHDDQHSSYANRGGHARRHEQTEQERKEKKQARKARRDRNQRKA